MNVARGDNSAVVKKDALGTVGVDVGIKGRDVLCCVLNGNVCINGEVWADESDIRSGTFATGCDERNTGAGGTFIASWTSDFMCVSSIFGDCILGDARVCAYGACTSL